MANKNAKIIPAVAAVAVIGSVVAFSGGKDDADINDAVTTTKATTVTESFEERFDREYDEWLKENKTTTARTEATTEYEYYDNTEAVVVQEQEWTEAETEATVQEHTVIPPEDNSPIVYITPTGKKYHYDDSCNGGSYSPTTLNKAEKMHLEPCKKCAGG